MIAYPDPLAAVVVEIAAVSFVIAPWSSSCGRGGFRPTVCGPTTR